MSSFSPHCAHHYLYVFCLFKKLNKHWIKQMIVCKTQIHFSVSTKCRVCSAHAWVKFKQRLQRRPCLTSEFFVLQRSMGMSYLNTDQLQMRTVQTEAVAVHRMRAGKKINEWMFESFSPIRENSWTSHSIFLIKITLKKGKVVGRKLIISPENLLLMVCCKAIWE